jgi:hypothetical protein
MPTDLAFAQLMRLVWIDHHLASGQMLRRADIQTAFLISTVQASHDIRTYERLYPGRLDYNRSAKAYRMRYGAQPAFPSRLRISVHITAEEMADCLGVANG